MYINVGIGTPENKKQYNVVDYNFDSQPFYFYDYGSQTIKSIDQASSANYGVKKYDMLDKDGQTISNGAISLYVDFQNNTGPSSIIEQLVALNNAAFDQLSFGLFNAEQDCIVPFEITYTNRASGQGFSSSESNVEYTEVQLADDAPANWESERVTCYYTGRNYGTGQQIDYCRQQISTQHYDWSTLKTYIENWNESNPDNPMKLWYNDKLSKRVFVGTEEQGVSFSVSKADHSFVGGTSNYEYPLTSPFTRNVSTVYYSQTGGVIKSGFDPVENDYNLWTVNSPWNTGGYGYFISSSTKGLTPFYTNGRLSTTAPVTKAHPITECTLLQFGQVTFGTKKYFGVWRVNYKSAFYWGYKGNSTSNEWTPGAWNQLSTTAVTYGPEMNRQAMIESFQFSGICLDDIDVVPDIHEGKIPVPPKPGPGSGSYDYPSFPHDVWHTKAFNVLAGPTESGFHIYYMNKGEFATFIAEISRWSSFARQMTKDASDLWSNVTSAESLGEILLNLLGSVDNTSSAILNTSVDLNSTIVFCRKMPRFVGDYAVTNTGYPLRIGTGTINGLYPNYFVTERVVCMDDTQFHFDANTDSLGFQTATFYDLEPYVQAKLFLPYYGEVTLPISSFIDGSIVVSYAADVCSGNGGVLVITTDKDGNNCTFGPYQCDISVNIPLAVTDANAQGRMQSMTKAAVTTAVAAATGGTGVALAGALSALDAAAQKRVNQTISTLGSNNGFLTPENIILQLTYPATIPDKDGEKNLDATIAQIGASSYQNGKVSEFLTGKVTKYSYVNTSGINATEAEKRAIEALLRGGVY